MGTTEERLVEVEKELDELRHSHQKLLYRLEGINRPEDPELVARQKAIWLKYFPDGVHGGNCRICAGRPNGVIILESPNAERRAVFDFDAFSFVELTDAALIGALNELKAL